MKLFNVDQIAWLDQYTIEHEPILSLNLMERAAYRVFERIKSSYSNNTRITVLAGPGNNGGDGLALARILVLDQWDVTVCLVHDNLSLSSDATQNLSRLRLLSRVKIIEFGTPGVELPKWDANDVVVDALFGAGLNRPCTGVFAQVIEMVNASDASVWSIDLPSGLMGEETTSGSGNGNIVRADVTLTFQFPKLSFLMPENEPFVGRWEILDIGLHSKAIAMQETPFYFNRRVDVAPLVKKRLRFAHKGILGHAGLLAGSKGKFGAAVLCSHAALRSGAGLVTAVVPAGGELILHSALPEVMVNADVNTHEITQIPALSAFDAIGVGPGIGTSPQTALVLKNLLEEARGIPMVLDADALNILSHNKEWLNLLHSQVILTPHPGEMDRLTKVHSSSYERMQSAREFAKTYGCIVVLKGAFSQVVLPDGSCYFNGSGCAGMATAGSGDVLTGIITGLLAQGYNPYEAAVLGVYWHGRAGEVASRELGENAMIAGDMVYCMGKAFLEITNSNN